MVNNSTGVEKINSYGSPYIKQGFADILFIQCK